MRAVLDRREEANEFKKDRIGDETRTPNEQESDSMAKNHLLHGHGGFPRHHRFSHFRHSGFVNTPFPECFFYGRVVSDR